MRNDAADLSRRLAREAEAVCRRYLPHGRRAGHYWLAGDVEDTPGRSLYVRLDGPESGPGAAGKWSDAATGEHGDLLDLIAARRKCASFAETLEEARAFLALPRREDARERPSTAQAPRGSSESARRLFAASRPIANSLAEAYLRRRGLADVRGLTALRFHPRCYHRGADDAPVETWPALIAAVTDSAGAIMGVQRTYLDPALARTDAILVNDGKAPFEEPRRAIGALLGNGVRFGAAGPVMIAGEGVETMLSLRHALPGAPLIAALTANHLAALAFPPVLTRLYVARDADDAGDSAFARLSARGDEAGVEVLGFSPQRDDFNSDLRAFGAETLRRALLAQLDGRDAARVVHRR